ncbi:MAG: CbtB-domain containing protein [Acidimicrobiia bacterium]
MTSHTVSLPDAAVLPEVRIPAWAWAVVLAATGLLYLVAAENGATLGAAANTLHEFFHDGRHFSGIPCH